MANRPTITIESNDVTATNVPVVLAGTAGIGYTLRLISPSGTVESSGTVTGSGTVNLTPAGAGRKFIIAFQTTAANADPSRVREVIVPAASATPTVAWYRVTGIVRVQGAPKKACVVERIERPIEA
ncbi:hypothetical protein LCGC14_2480400 [marine sediment metagenome]|uniref:Uncharacterized protein n=1 Tax=marine sediment metagenome TaxID=412755 RepID=A0A0F9B7S1_9ZZZZ